VFEAVASAEPRRSTVPKEIIDRRIQGISTGMKKIEAIHYKRDSVKRLELTKEMLGQCMYVNVYMYIQMYIYA
jgi:hypothetical protein